MLPAFSIEHVQATAERGEIRLRGILAFAEAAPLWTELRKLETSATRGQTLDFEMSRVQRIDGAAMALLACLRTKLQRRGVKSEFVAANPTVQGIIHLYGGDHAIVRLKRRRPIGTLDQLGRGTLAFLDEARRVLAFFGEMVVTAARVLRSPRSANWPELPPTMERSGADAVPVILLINFLVGLAMAFQSAAQLKQFGANILVADLIGISICRELGPLRPSWWSLTIWRASSRSQGALHDGRESQGGGATTVDWRRHTQLLKMTTLRARRARCL